MSEIAPLQIPTKSRTAPSASREYTEEHVVHREIGATPVPSYYQAEPSAVFRAHGASAGM